jgi:hypothetical protein
MVTVKKRAVVMAMRVAGEDAGDGKGGKSNGNGGNCKEEGNRWTNLQNKIKSFVSALDQPIAKIKPRGVGY